MKNFYDVLWAKKPQNNDEPSEIISLQEHLEQTTIVAEMLWETWLPPLLKSKIDKKVFMFLAYAHDIGKASPVFQTDERNSLTPQTNEYIRTKLIKAGFPLKDLYPEKEHTRHELISYAVLKRHGVHNSVCVTIGGHHGLPPNENKITKLSSYKSNCGFDNEVWKDAQDFFVFTALEKSGLTKEEVANVVLTRQVQVLLSGLIILADWIASSEEHVKMPPMWVPQDIENIYSVRFNINAPRPIQEKLMEAVQESTSPGIFIIEAPMGEGKTEAALAASEILAKKVGCRGVYFALPSQATSNAMLTRIRRWIDTFQNQDGALSIRLAHGKADLNEEYEGIKISTYRESDDESAVAVYDWLTGRKKGILADFTIGTIDHVLMAGLKQKHLALRHLGLSKKVLIIDECHAYDVYMESYLLTSLKWLGAYGVPVIILSATLPIARRADIVRAYLNKDNTFDENEPWAKTIAYPLITYTNNDTVHSLSITKPTQGRTQTVAVEKLDDESFISTVENELKHGGCAGIIFNTVRKAQEAFEKLSEKFGSETVELLHSGFIAVDRAKREEMLLTTLGEKASKRPKKRIVVGTQIFEQSLDIDFDVMITELCPIDLLLQRIGRLHRHKRDDRPVGLQNPKCYVLGANWGNFDKGSCYVYSEYLLMRTCAVLPLQISLPNDIPNLVGNVYNIDFEVSIPSDFTFDYTRARYEWEFKTEDRKQKAKNFQIKGSVTDKSINGWIDSPSSDVEGEAAVRDGIDTLEVLLIQRRNNELYFLPWVQNGEQLPLFTPNSKQAKAIAGCAVRLPAVLNYKISETIKLIESSMSEAGIVDSWYKSYWLKGSLVLILDENQSVTLGNYILHYNQEKGLNYWEEKS